jgi:hypothetical protein
LEGRTDILHVAIDDFAQVMRLTVARRPQLRDTVELSVGTERRQVALVQVALVLTVGAKNFQFRNEFLLPLFHCLGIDWSGESRDQKWANRPQAGQGYQHADGDGPSPSTATLRYVLVAPDKAVLNSGAALFLPNGISVAIIFHRFYLGRSVKDYIDDFTTAATALSELNDVDGQRLAFMGTSLGGFVAAYAHVHSKLPVKAVVFFYRAL